MLDDTTAEQGRLPRGRHGAARHRHRAAAARRPRLVGTAAFGGSTLVGASVVMFDTAQAQDLFLQGDDAFSQVVGDGGTRHQPGAAARCRHKALPKDTQAATGDATAARAASRIDEALSFVTHLPARLRRHRPDRRGLPHRQHLLDPRGPAQPRAGPAAGDRREPPPGGAVGAPRGGRGRARRARPSGSASACCSPSASRTVFGRFGLDLSKNAARARAAHGGREPRRRRARHPGGRLPAGATGRQACPRSPRCATTWPWPRAACSWRLTVGAVLLAAGIAGMAAGLLGVGSEPTYVLGAGAFGVLVGTALLSPVLGRPVLAGLGWVYRRGFGAVGLMAEQNTLRNPRRTAATASALMIGVSLVTMMAVLGASAKASLDKTLAEDIIADYVVTNPVGQPFSSTVARDIEQVPGRRGRRAGARRAAPGRRRPRLRHRRRPRGHRGRRRPRGHHRLAVGPRRDVGGASRPTSREEQGPRGRVDRHHRLRR